MTGVKTDLQKSPLGREPSFRAIRCVSKSKAIISMRAPAKSQYTFPLSCL